MIKVRKKRPKLEKPIAVADSIFSMLTALGYAPIKSRLALLWRNWPGIVGEDLAEIASPLGDRNGELLIGAENSMHIMELHYVTEEILEKVNRFLEEDYFSAVYIMLETEGKNCLPAKAARLIENSPPVEEHFTPSVTGKYLVQMDPSSPVARCYARFAGKTI